jgi:Uma2 family endonuclease
MVLQRNFVTVAEFDRYVDLPENADKLFEYIGGEIVEVPSAPYSSAIASQISSRIGGLIDARRLGYITGEGAGYVVSGERYVPNVAYLSRLRMPELPRIIGYVPLAPDLVVEIPSPADYEKHLRIKTLNYLAAGTVVWLIDASAKRIEFYAPGQPMKWVGMDGVLDGGAALPGFTLPVKEIFPE